MIISDSFRGSSGGPTGPGGGTVSSLLVPSIGAWWGTSMPGLAAAGNLNDGYDEYMSAIEWRPHILHFYNTNASSFFNSTHMGLLQPAGQNPAMALYNYKPNMTATWAQIAAGNNATANANIDNHAQQMRAYGKKFFLAPHHEPDDDINMTAGSGYTPQDYINFFRYVVDRLRIRNGVTNIVTVWNVMGFAGWKNQIDDYYPGHAYVDWIAFDPYDHGLNLFSELINRTNGQTYTGSNPPYTGFYDWAVKKAPDKPIMLAETGSGGDAVNADAVWNSCISHMKSYATNLKAIVYWHSSVAPREVQTLNMNGAPTGGTFRLTWDGSQTGTLPHNATATQIQTALRGLVNTYDLAGISVTGGPFPAAEVRVSFGQVLTGNVPQITLSANALTGGSNPTVVIATTNQGLANNYYRFEHPYGVVRPTAALKTSIRTIVRDPFFNSVSTLLAP